MQVARQGPWFALMETIEKLPNYHMTPQSWHWPQMRSEGHCKASKKGNKFEQMLFQDVLFRHVLNGWQLCSPTFLTSTSNINWFPKQTNQQRMQAVPLSLDFRLAFTSSASTGVPQGSVLRSLLLVLFTHNYPPIQMTKTITVGRWNNSCGFDHQQYETAYRENAPYTGSITRISSYCCLQLYQYQKRSKYSPVSCTYLSPWSLSLTIALQSMTTPRLHHL